MKIFNKIKKLIQKNQASLSDNQFFTNKTDITKLLDKYNIKNYIINDDLSVDVSGDVDISNKKLKTIPVKFGNVTGGFYCNDNRLSSLAGSPNTVGGNFWCDDNKITSLSGSPETVGESFFCHNSQLTGLIGAPKTVGGDFNCASNQLTSLAGSPEIISGNFYCSRNHLISLAETINCNFKGKIYFNIDENNFLQKELIQILKKYYASNSKRYELTNRQFQDIIKPHIEKEILQQKLNKYKLNDNKTINKSKNNFL